jgi:hypothetical protein
MTSGRSCPLRHVRAGDKRGRQIHHVSRAGGSVRLLRDIEYFTSRTTHTPHRTAHGSRQARAQVSKHRRGAAPGPRCIAGMIAGSAVSRWPYHDVSRNMLTIENQSARRRGMHRRGLNLKRARAAVRLRLRLTLSTARAAVSPRAPGAAHPSRPRDARHDVQANGTTVATPIKRGTRGARDGALP